MRDASDDREPSPPAGGDGTQLPERASLVPRWLAWIVLIALVGAAACSVASILSR